MHLNNISNIHICRELETSSGGVHKFQIFHVHIRIGYNDNVDSS